MAAVEGDHNASPKEPFLETEIGYLCAYLAQLGILHVFGLMRQNKAPGVNPIHILVHHIT